MIAPFSAVDNATCVLESRSGDTTGYTTDTGSIECHFGRMIQHPVVGPAVHFGFAVGSLAAGAVPAAAVVAVELAAEAELQGVAVVTEAVAAGSMQPAQRKSVEPAFHSQIDAKVLQDKMAGHFVVKERRGKIVRAVWFRLQRCQVELGMPPVVHWRKVVPLH